MGSICWFKKCLIGGFGVRATICCNFVKSCLDDCGVGYLWLDQTVLSSTWLKTKVKQSLGDQYKQNILSEIMDHPKCVMYRTYCNEDNFSIENYLLKLPDVLVNPLMSFRLGRNKLPAVLGRNRNLEHDDWYCTLCDTNKIGDEFHYLLECPFFNNPRLTHLGNYF